MPLLNVSGIYKSFGAQPVLEGAALQLQPGEKAGLIGPNGSGKTTLLKIIAGQVEADAGEVHLARGTALGYLAQEQPPEAAGSLRRRLEEPLRPLLEMKRELSALEQQIASLSREMKESVRLHQLLERYGMLSTRFEEQSGYQVESRILAVAQGLGFDPSELDRDLSCFSGGEKTRARLAFLLLQEPDLLLLDEPTNFLDMEALYWLEKFLRDWPRALLVVSHDRYFLDRVAGRIFALERSKVKSYTGNYTAYLAQFQQEQADRERVYRRQQELLDRENKLIRESKADERSKRQARSRQKRLEKVEQVERPVEERSFNLGFDYAGRGSRVMISFEDIAKSFGEAALFQAINFEIRWGERVALVGPNGAGKTTLLKMIAGEVEPSAGKIRLGPAVRIVYFAQEQEQLDPGRTLIEEITAATDLDVKQARNHLGRYLFQGDDVFKKVRDLSGGEKSRLALARLALTSGNCLLMDEPTSHLDLPAVEQLEKALQGYPGTIIVVSHDRYFLTNLANRVFELESDGLRLFESGFTEYLLARDERPRAREKPEKKEEKDLRRLERLEQKERQRQERQLLSEQERLESDIADAEAVIARLEHSLADPDNYSDYNYLGELGEQLEEEKNSLAVLLRRWEEVSRRLENQ
ncbi:MAG: ABC-F family ATP-binding cassette domain-containing protein [Bacillota bacterium]